MHENVSVSMFCSHGEQHCVDGYLILDHQVPASMLSPLALFVMELKGLFQIYPNMITNDRYNNKFSATQPMVNIGALLVLHRFPH